MGLIIFLILIFLVIGAAPSWPYSRRWGYRPTGVIGAILLIWFILLLIAVIPWWGYPGYY